MSDGKKDVLKVPPASNWTVIESSQFQLGAAKYLTARELRALIRDLVTDPLSGEPVSQYPGFFILTWGKLAPVEILYTVGESQILALVDIQRSTGITEVEPAQKPDLDVIYEVAKKAMGWVAGRGVWELIKKMLGLD